MDKKNDQIELGKDSSSVEGRNDKALDIIKSGTKNSRNDRRVKFIVSGEAKKEKMEDSFDTFMKQEGLIDDDSISKFNNKARLKSRLVQH